MRSILTLVLALFLWSSPVLAGDPMVAKAVARIVKVETAEVAMKAGDKQAAAKLNSDLNWAQKRLNAVVQNGSAEWKAANARLKAVRSKVDAKLKQSAPKPAPKPEPAPGSGPKPKPAPKPAPATAYEHAKLVALNKDIGNAWNNLKVVPLRLLKDANRVNGVRREIESLRTRLAAFPVGDANVKLVTSNLNDFEALLDSGVKQLAGDQGQVASIEKRIAALDAKYARDALPQPMEPPFTKGNLEAWALQIRQMRDKDLPADIAWLKSIQGNGALKQNLASGKRVYLETSVARQLGGIEKGVRELIASPVVEQLRNCDWILETDPKDKNHVQNRILGRGAMDRNMLLLRQGLEAVDLAECYDRAMGAACVLGPTLTDPNAPRPAFPDRGAQRKKIQSAMAHLKLCAVSALDSMRMPAAASTDVDLLKIAKAELQRPKNNVMEWERMVINRDKKRHERRTGWIEPGSLNTATLTMYTYVWEDFIVTTAEKRGDEIWLFSNKFVNYSSGDKRTTTGEWYLSQRVELTRILPENLDKPPLPEVRAPKQD